MTEFKRAPQISDAVARRLAQRHRAEIRFQVYGLSAIGVAILVLLILLGSIGYKAVSAFSAHTLTLNVVIDPDLADPRGDRSESSLRRGSYNRMMQTALETEFPGVTSRAHMRELFGLYTAVNAAGLLQKVVKSPDLIGETVTYEMPISDDVDLYLKGRSVEERFEDVEAPLSLIEHEDGVALSSPAPVFEGFLTLVREAYITRAEAAEARASAAFDRASLPGIDAQTAEAERANAQRELRTGELWRERVTRLNTEGLTLQPDGPRLLVRVNEGVVRVTRLSADGRSAEGEVVLPLENLAQARHWTRWILETPASAARLTDRQIVWTRALEERGFVKKRFNTWLFTRADSREPELAGVLGSAIGSVLTMMVTMLLAVPIGVGAAIYLEEFAPKNRWSDWVEVNINNLAAVPSIVFGLLGLALFINGFGLPRSAPLVGGMVLALMTLPTVIISSRAALKAVPLSIREAALGIGASRMQTVFHHVLPLAAPGILTGAIIGLAQAFGETAPLLMIGMVAFIADAPSLSLGGFLEPATVMPVQVYLWSSGVERAFEMRTAAAIMVLLGLMIILNAFAIYLRRRFERRW
ncbi:phosphate ABC transporter permease PstA [Woodsholea maritima]|uniref:phosphate ABC transporter permease PstA n=1 Tax=Woodsholea maritima TaxID=240237 RepID=UPI0003622EAE|nr:phosphate ABC transporter permease PstA [Woodsholea maritima]